MATVNGNKVKYLNNPNLSAVEYYAQIEYSVSYPNASQAKVSWTFRVQHGGRIYDSFNKAGCSGSLKSTTTWTNKKYSSSGSGSVYYASGTTTISRSTSNKTITQSFWVENLAEDSKTIPGGARSTAKATITINAKPETASRPSRPAAPTTSSVTQSSFKANMKLPASNGASITETDFRRYTQASGGSYVTDGKVTTGTSTTFTGLSAGTDYWVACLAKNSKGWSDESPRTKVTTTALSKPDAPGALVISNLDSDSYTITVPAADGNGNAVTAYQILVDNNSNVSSPFINEVQAGRTLNVSGRTPGATDYAKARAKNAAGWGGWSAIKVIDLDSTAPRKPAPPKLKASTETRAFFELPPTGTQGSPIIDVQFQVSSSSGYGTLIHDSSSLILDRTVVGLAEGINYFARQRAQSVDGWSAWSDNLKFQTGNMGSGGSIGVDGEWKLFEYWLGVDGEWKLAEMWVGANSEWKLTG